MLEALPEGLPEVGLASEHWFDDVVFGRLKSGAGVPYPGAKSVLVELSPQQFPIALPARLLDLRRAGLSPVVAHPERYQPTWKDTEALQPLIDAGACLLLDVCALVGKYGDRAEARRREAPRRRRLRSRVQRRAPRRGRRRDGARDRAAARARRRRRNGSTDATRPRSHL